MLKGTQLPDVGIVLDRPDRSYFLAEGLRQLGFRVVLYNNVKGSTRYVSVGKGFPEILSHLLLRTNHDIYLTSTNFAPSLSLCCNRWLTRRPYLFVLNGAIWQYFKDRNRRKPFRSLRESHLYPFLLNRVFAGAQRIICNSHYLRKELNTLFPQYQEKSLTIYNGIDFERLSGHAELNPLKLVSVMTLNYENKSRGAFFLLDAIDRVLSVKREAQFTLAAKTSSAKYPELLQRHLASKKNKARMAIYFNHPNVPELLKSSGLFLFGAAPDSDHSLPRALLEAQTIGLPVVTTDTAGCAEIVIDGETGFTVPYDAGTLTKKVLELMDNPHLRKKFSELAALRIRRVFTWENMAAQYSEVIIDALGNSADQRRSPINLGA